MKGNPMRKIVMALVILLASSCIADKAPFDLNDDLNCLTNITHPCL